MNLPESRIEERSAKPDEGAAGVKFLGVCFLVVVCGICADAFEGGAWDLGVVALAVVAWRTLWGEV